MPSSIRALAAIGFASALPMLPLAAAEPATIAPIASDDAAVQIARGVEILVTVGPEGELHAAVRDRASAPAEAPIEAEDPSVRAVLTMLGHEGAARFAIAWVKRLDYVEICERIGDDYLCRKVCS